MGEELSEQEAVQREDSDEGRAQHSRVQQASQLCARFCWIEQGGLVAGTELGLPKSISFME